MITFREVWYDTLDSLLSEYDISQYRKMVVHHKSGDILEAVTEILTRLEQQRNGMLSLVGNEWMCDCGVVTDFSRLEGLRRTSCGCLRPHVRKHQSLVGYRDVDKRAWRTFARANPTSDTTPAEFFAKVGLAKSENHKFLNGRWVVKNRQMSSTKLNKYKVK
jgi:hypothetical protein